MVASDLAYLKLLECRAIAGFNTMAPVGYNLTPGGDGVTKLIGAAKRRHLASVRKVFADPKFRAKLSAAAQRNSGLFSKRLSDNWADPEWSAKVRGAVAKTQSSKAYRIKHARACSKAQTVRFNDPKSAAIAREQAGRGWRGKAQPEVTKKAVGKASKTRWKSAAYRARLSKSFKKAWADPEVRQARVKNATAAQRRPEVRAKRSASVRAAYAADPTFRLRIGSGIKTAWADPVRRAPWSASIKAAWAKRKTRKG